MRAPQDRAERFRNFPHLHFRPQQVPLGIHAQRRVLEQQAHAVPAEWKSCQRIRALSRLAVPPADVSQQHRGARGVNSTKYLFRIRPFRDPVLLNRRNRQKFFDGRADFLRRQRIRGYHSPRPHVSRISKLHDRHSQREFGRELPVE